MRRFLFLAITLLFQQGVSLHAQKVDWMSWNEAVKATQEEPKKIFVDVYTDWCGWCKKMDKTTFSDPTIASYLNENYYPVKFDAEMREDIVFRGDTLRFKKRGKRGTHELALNLMKGRASYPTVVILNEDIQLITPIPGYRKPKTMEPILTYFAQDQHKDRVDINKYIKNYQSIKQQKAMRIAFAEELPPLSESSSSTDKRKSKKNNSNASDHGKEHKGPVKWMNWEEMKEAQRDERKLVMIDIYTSWCGPCKLLDKKTFSDMKVASYINEHFYAVKLDGESRDTLHHGGKTFINTSPNFKKSSSRGRGRPHELALSLVDGKLAYPALVFLTGNYKRVRITKGYRGPEKMLELLRSVVEEQKGK